jgi:hypothetical protein
MISWLSSRRNLYHSLKASSARRKRKQTREAFRQTPNDASKAVYHEPHAFRKRDLKDIGADLLDAS